MLWCYRVSDIESKRFVSSSLSSTHLDGNRLARTFRSRRQSRTLWPWRGIGGTLSAVLTLVMFEAHLRQGEMLSLKLSSIPTPTESGDQILVIRQFFETRTTRSKTGEADDTISLDSKRFLWMGPVFERLQHWQPQDKPLLSLNYAEYLFAVLSSRRKHAGRNGTTPLWSSGGQGRTFANVGVHTDTRTMEVGEICAGQSSLHWSRRIASNATSCPRHCFMVTPLRGFVFSARSFQLRHRLAIFFLNRAKQCDRLDPFF